MLFNIDNAVFWMQLLLSVGILIQFFHEIANYVIFQDKGLLAWSTVSIFSRISKKHLLFRLLRFLKNAYILLFILGLQALLVVSMNLNINTEVKKYLIIIAFLIQLMINFRFRSIISGPLQMRLLLLAGLVFYYFGNDNTEIYFVAFVCFHSLFSYFMPGILKIGDRNWFSGLAIRHIILAKANGENIKLAVLITKLPILSKIIASVILIFECIMPIVALIHPWFAVMFILMGVSFHMANGMILGFNNFILIFIAPYPLILYCSFIVHNMIIR